MALPSTSRPMDISEYDFTDLIVIKTEEKRKSDEAEVTKLEVFKKKVGDWYKKRGPLGQSKVTRMDLKRAAVRICDANGINYDHDLPKDWVTTFTNEYKVTFKKDRRKRKKKIENRTVTPSKRPRLRLSLPSLPIVTIKEEIITPEGSEDENDEAGNMEGFMQPQPSTSTAFLSNHELGKQTPAGGSSLAGSSSYSKASEEKKKKFVDLTKDIPPPTWVKAYAEGIELPRVLSFYETEDSKIMYYNYAPKLKDKFGREIKMQAQPVHNMDFRKIYPDDSDED